MKDNKGFATLSFIAPAVFVIVIIGLVAWHMHTTKQADKIHTVATYSATRTYCSPLTRACFSYPDNWGFQNVLAGTNAPASKEEVLAFAPKQVAHVGYETNSTTASVPCAANDCTFTTLSATRLSHFADVEDVQGVFKTQDIENASGVFENTGTTITPEEFLVSVNTFNAYKLHDGTTTDLGAVINPTFTTTANGTSVSQSMIALSSNADSYSSVDSALSVFSTSQVKSAHQVLLSLKPE